MIYKQLNDQFSVSDQITVEDLAEIAQHDVQLLVCNRPDDEEPNQPKFADIQQAAQTLGIEATLLDFASYHIEDDNRDKLIELMEKGQKTHLYCRTGARSTRLWRSTVALTMSHPE